MVGAKATPKTASLADAVASLDPKEIGTQIKRLDAATKRHGAAMELLRDERNAAAKTQVGAEAALAELVKVTNANSRAHAQSTDMLRTRRIAIETAELKQQKTHADKAASLKTGLAEVAATRTENKIEFKALEIQNTALEKRETALSVRELNVATRETMITRITDMWNAR